MDPAAADLMQPPMKKLRVMGKCSNNNNSNNNNMMVRVMRKCSSNSSSNNKIMINSTEDDEPLLNIKKTATTAESVIISELPPEILASIFSRLPAVYLQSLRRVCKSWDSIISGRDFAEQHYNHQANNGKGPGIISLSSRYRSSKDATKISSLKFSEGDSRSITRYEFDMSNVLKKPYYTISNSCNGLICVFSLVNTFVINPSIRRMRRLPRGGKHDPISLIPCDPPLVGIGFDPSTGAYKVVRMFCPKDKSKRRPYISEEESMSCEVCTLGGASHSWKAVGKVPIPADHFTFLRLSPIFVNGAIHWEISGQPRQHIPDKRIALSFRIEDETFGIILHPKGSSRPHLCSSVRELNGCLCVCDRDRSEKHIDIWVLKDYENRKWIKQYNIDLTMMLNWSWYECSGSEPVTVRDGKLLFCNEEGRMDYYDVEGENFVKHEQSIVLYQYDVPYIGSLIWPREERDTRSVWTDNEENTTQYSFLEHEANSGPNIAL